MGDEVMQQEDGAVTSARKRRAICGASSTSVCVLPPRHEGLCSYWADSELNKQLKAELAQARADNHALVEEWTHFRDQRDYWQEAFDGMRMDAQRAQAERDAALAVVETVQKWHGHTYTTERTVCAICKAFDAFDKARQGGGA